MQIIYQIARAVRLTAMYELFVLGIKDAYILLNNCNNKQGYLCLLTISFIHCGMRYKTFLLNHPPSPFPFPHL